MPVKFAALNAWTLIEKVGCSPSIVSDLKSSGWDASLTVGAFTLHHPNSSQVYEVPVTLGLLSAIHKGTAGPKDTAALAEAIETGVFEALSETVPPVASSGSVLSKLPPIEGKQPAPPAAPPVAAPSVSMLTPQEQAALTPVKLNTATRLYQPVFGTDPGSRYYVVAMREGLNVAARFKSGKLSIRAEGSGLSKYKTALASSGLALHSASTYASLHLNAGDTALAAKSLGAILAGLGVQFDTPLPDFNRLKV